MSKYTGPKYRLCRREGINLFGNERYNLKKKTYGPGMHGPKGSFSKPSEYGRQLREKQKLKRLYGVTERQLSNYFAKATKKKEITGDALVRLLEMRLDNVIYRAGLAKSRPQARQMVNHGLFKINGQRITIPSYQVKLGDVFEAVDRIKNSPLFKEIQEQRYAAPKWIKVDTKKLAGEVIRTLEAHEFEKVVLTHLVVEYYSK